MVDMNDPGDAGRSLDLQSLGSFLSQAMEEPPSGAVNASLIAGGRSNPTYLLSDPKTKREWVLRRPPYGDVLPSTHDVGREARVISALYGTAVPVPSVLVHCKDPGVIGAPFYVMEKIDGRTYRTQRDTAELTERQRAGLASSLVDLLVTLHEVEPVSVGLGEWGRPEGYLQRQLQRWSGQWRKVATEDRPEVNEIVRRLGATLPETRFSGIVHGDYKIDNVLVAHHDPTVIVGLLDWEMSTRGDTLADLGLLVSFWDEEGSFHNPITAGATAHRGFPAAREVVERYVARRGINVDDIDWYIVFADLKIAVVLEQIHARHLAGDTTGAGFDDIGAMVGPLLQRALDRSSVLRTAPLRGVS